MNKSDIEARECRGCGALKSCPCIEPRSRPVFVTVAAAGGQEFCYQRVFDYFESFRPPPHAHYVWKHGVTSGGGRYKQCGCGRVTPTTASQDDLEAAKKGQRDVQEQYWPRPSEGKETAKFIKHVVTPRFENDGYRGHCTCGWLSECYPQLEAVGSATEIHLRHAHTAHE